MAAKAGIQQGLHNEGFEVSMVDGKRTYRHLVRVARSEAGQIRVQMSTIRNGFDAAEYFMKYPGRFISMHLAGLERGNQDLQQQSERAVLTGRESLAWPGRAGSRTTSSSRTWKLTKEGVAFLKTLKV